MVKIYLFMMSCNSVTIWILKYMLWLFLRSMPYLFQTFVYCSMKNSIYQVMYFGIHLYHQFWTIKFSFQFKNIIKCRIRWGQCLAIIIHHYQNTSPTLIFDISFLSSVCSKNLGLTWCKDPWKINHTCYSILIAV